MKIILRHSLIEWTDDGCITYFQDGSSIGAQPHPGNHHYRIITARTGLGDDVMAYCRTHELAHLFLEERLHDRPSQVLWALAHGKMLCGADAAYEEIAAQAFQAWVYANRRPIVSGIPWDPLKADFLALLTPAGLS